MREQNRLKRWLSEPAAEGAYLFDLWDALEITYVRKFAYYTQFRILRGVALIVNLLSNGSLYPILAILILAVLGKQMLPALSMASLSVLAAHSCYPKLKKHFARTRPCEHDLSIHSLLRPLDQHSFPSGHVMTAVAAFVPLGATLPSLIPFAVGLISLIAWARLAAGHHYPSDLFAGVLLGGLCAAPWLLFL